MATNDVIDKTTKINFNNLVKDLHNERTRDNASTRETLMRYLYTHPLVNVIQPQYREKYTQKKLNDRTDRIYGFTEDFIDKVDGEPWLNGNLTPGNDEVPDTTIYRIRSNTAFRMERRGKNRAAGQWGYAESNILQRKPQQSEGVEDVQPDASDIKIIDKDWVMGKFMTPTNDLENVDKANRFFSSASWKFSSTRLGYSLAVNARPQFTRYADIKGNHTLGGFPQPVGTEELEYDQEGNVISGGAPTSIFQPVTVMPMKPGENQLGFGMGRYYSEAIDDNATTIFMEFGVPEFNSLLTYFTRAIDPADSLLANKGRIPLAYYIGAMIGSFVTFCAFPWVTILIFIGKGLAEFFFGGDLNYYYLKPAMHVYWSTVGNIVSQIATEIGLISPYFTKPESQANKIGMPVTIDSQDLKALAAYSPDLIKNGSGYLDIYAATLRMQKIANYQARLQYEAYLSAQTNGEKWAEEGNTSPNPEQVTGYVTNQTGGKIGRAHV